LICHPNAILFHTRSTLLKSAMIDAGSVVFVKNLLTDILSEPELAGATIALHDIDPA